MHLGRGEKLEKLTMTIFTNVSFDKYLLSTYYLSDRSRRWRYNSKEASFAQWQYRSQ